MMKNENLLDNIKNTSNEEKEALDLKRKGESLLNPKCCLDTLCSSTKSRYSKSCNLYKKSADKYKSCFQWRKAAECYEKCAEIKLTLEESPTEYYKEAIVCYQNVSILNAKRVLFKLIDDLEKKGELFEAGKNCENMGIKFENEKKYEDAIYFYEEAINYYEKNTINEELIINLKNKLIELIIINGYPNEEKYLIEFNEDIGMYLLKKNSFGNTAEHHFGKAVLSVIYYKGVNEAESYINKYKIIDKKFESSYIYKLCIDIIDDIKINNVNKLYNDINNYKSLNECDDYMINILEKIEKKMKK